MPWKDYALKATSTDATPLTSLYHVTHIETAIRIIKDKTFRAGLVFDNSKLNTDRILVNWLSPNEWAYGSRYGNVAFEFSFKSLIADKNFYWVEAMTDYTPHACRILVTKENHDSNESLERYLPDQSNGPWKRLNGNEEFWNGAFCLEFMFETDIRLDQVKKIRFLSHHNKFCNIDYANCRDLGRASRSAATYFLAGIYAEDIELHLSLFTTLIQGNHLVPNDQVKNFCHDIRDLIAYTPYAGNVASTDTAALPLIKSVLFFISKRDPDSAGRLLGLFSTQADALSIFERLMINRLQVSNTQHLYHI